MESMMKRVSSAAVAQDDLILLDAGALAGGPRSGYDDGDRRVEQALAAVADAAGTTELAQRLAGALAMLWSDVTAADLFLPHGQTGELRGVRDAARGADLLASVAVPVAGDPAVRVIPVTPSLAPAVAGRGAAMSAAVLSAGNVEGFLGVQRRPDAPNFSRADVEALAALARGVGDGLPAVRARGRRTAAGWLQRDLAQAREMQRQFLPRPQETNSAGVRVLAEYLPAHAVGGDFYDFIDLGGGRVLAAIGDVSGKGVTAALMMSRISSELRRLAKQTGSPAELLTRLNQSLPRMQDDRFVTVVCVLLDLPARRWLVGNAGHVVPVLRRSSGAVTGLGYASGPPIGLVADPQYADEELPVGRGDILVLATDGAFDNVQGARRACSTMGTCKLTEIVQKAPHDLAEIHRRILEATGSMTVGRDDVALLGLELLE